MQDDGTGATRFDGDEKVPFYLFGKKIPAIHKARGLRGVANQRPLLVGILSLIFLLESQPALPQDEPEDRFSENLTVVERTVFIDAAALPTMGSVLRKSDSDFLVLIDGVAVELADADADPPRAPGADPAADAAEEPPEGDLATVTHMIWLDFDLASPPYVAGAATLLANTLPYLRASERISLVEMSRDSSRTLENLSRTELSLWLRRLAARAENGHASPADDRAAARGPEPVGDRNAAAQHPGPRRPVADLRAVAHRADRVGGRSCGPLGAKLRRDRRGPSERGVRAIGARDPPADVADPCQRRLGCLPCRGAKSGSIGEPACTREGVRPDGFTEKSPSPTADRPVKAIPILISRLFGKRFRQKRALQLASLARDPRARDRDSPRTHGRVGARHHRLPGWRSDSHRPSGTTPAKPAASRGERSEPGQREAAPARGRVDRRGWPSRPGVALGGLPDPSGARDRTPPERLRALRSRRRPAPPGACARRGRGRQTCALFRLSKKHEPRSPSPVEARLSGNRGRSPRKNDDGRRRRNQWRCLRRTSRRPRGLRRCPAGGLGRDRVGSGESFVSAWAVVSAENRVSFSASPRKPIG